MPVSTNALMAKNGGLGFGSGRSVANGPTEKEISALTLLHGNNIDFACYVQNKCSPNRTGDSFNKQYIKNTQKIVQDIVLEKCEDDGMTKKEQKEVEKFAKSAKNPVAPWNRAKGYEVNDLKLLNQRHYYVQVPDHFTKTQMQYLCACLGEYGLDTLILAKANGKEAHIISYNANISSYRRGGLESKLYDVYPPSMVNIASHTENSEFGNTPLGGANYACIDLYVKDDKVSLKGTGLEFLAGALISDGLQRFRMPSSAVLNGVLEEPKQENEWGAMPCGDDVLNGDGAGTEPAQNSPEKDNGAPDKDEVDLAEYI